jgi:hypothetical protein
MPLYFQSFPMKLIFIFAWTMLPLVAEAQTLIHRYTFESGSFRGEDMVGQQASTITAERTYTEAPLFSEQNRPAARFASMQVGMAYGIKKSGLTLPTAVLAGNEGTIAFFAQATGSPNKGQGAYLVAGGFIDQGALIIQYAPFLLIAKAGQSERITVPAFPDHQWVHCALTWNNSTGEVVFFLNGEAVGKSQAKPGSFNTTVVNRVGSFNLSAEQPQALENQFQGYIYDLQVYDAPLIPAQVAKLDRAPGQALKELK